MTNTEIIDCTTCKYGHEDERLGIPMCHHPKRFSEDCVNFNMHEEKEIKESEKPMEGLEEEIQGKRKKLMEVFGPMNGEQVLALKDFARHFAKWGAEHFRDTTKKIEPPCHTVEEWIEHIKNADQLTKDIFSMGPYDVLYDALNRPYRDCYDAIKEFGELCYQTARQDMMEEAVEYEVWDFSSSLEAYPHVNIPLDNKQYRSGDKVRIIIVKED